MNEISKTGIFAGIAAAISLAAYFTETPTSINVAQVAEERVGQDLFPEFTKPLDVANLKIVQYDETLGSLTPFDIIRDSKSGLWTLPSHDSYPADAQDQMSKAANALIGVKILALASSQPDDQKLFGVVEPNTEKLNLGDTGVGLLVRMQNESGEPLANLIVGKKVKDSETQRYVRIATNDQIYVVDLDTTPFTTDFSKWIDKDLLQMSSTDVRKFDIRDYSIAITQEGGRMERNFNAALNYDTESGKWQSEKIVRFSEGVDTPVELAAGETLNASKLNAIKTALDSLQIANVGRKPNGLSANLKADEELLKDETTLRSLYARGFFPQTAADGTTELLASSGELLVSLNDGVQYLLRFGDSAAASQNADAASEDPGMSANRYLLVTAKVDESMIPEPELAKVPETIEELDAQQASAADAPATTETPTEEATDASTEEPTSEPAEDASASAEEATSEPAANDAGQATPPTEAAAEPEVTPDSPATPTESTDAAEPTGDQSNALVTDRANFVAFQDEASDAASVDEANDEAVTQVTDAAAQEPAAQPADAAENSPAEPETEQEKQERLQAAQEKIKKENQRKIDSREEKLEAAKKRVAELNARFAEWYYEINETQYQKLRISLEDLITNESAATSPQFQAPQGGFNFLPGQ